MSLAINTDTITAVLLADGWHDVTDKSFDLDAYEYLAPTPPGHDPFVLQGGGQHGITAIGFTCMSAGQELTGPLTAVLAVKTERKP